MSSRQGSEIYSGLVLGGVWQVFFDSVYTQQVRQWYACVWLGRITLVNSFWLLINRDLRDGAGLNFNFSQRQWGMSSLFHRSDRPWLIIKLPREAMKVGSFGRIQTYQQSTWRRVALTCIPSYHTASCSWWSELSLAPWVQESQRHFLTWEEDKTDSDA